MPRAKKEIQATAQDHAVAIKEPLFPIAEEKSTKKTTKRSLENLREKLLLEHSEPMLQETFKAMRQKIRMGDSRIIELALQLHGLVTGNKGPSLTANIIQSNNNRAEATSSSAIGKGFDSLVRKLDARSADGIGSEQTIEI